MFQDSSAFYIRSVISKCIAHRQFFSDRKNNNLQHVCLHVAVTNVTRSVQKYFQYALREPDDHAYLFSCFLFAARRLFLLLPCLHNIHEKGKPHFRRKRMQVRILI